jgi:hypothetical protein
MHLRHQNEVSKDELTLRDNKHRAIDSRFVGCLKEILARNQNKKCVLYVASDRPHSLLYIKNETAGLCTYRTVPRPFNAEFNTEHGYCITSTHPDFETNQVSLHFSCSPHPLS